MRLSVRAFSHLGQDVRSLRTPFSALKAMFSVKLIHRDVSCGNILLLQSPGERPRGLLVDLEYAKDITIQTMPHEFRTVSEAR
jgi:Fungal protein kinase